MTWWHFALLHLVGLFLIWWFGLDQDDGGYQDSFTTFYTWPYDKAYHLLGGAGICMLALSFFGLPAWQAVGGTILVGAGFEMVQRFPRKPRSKSGLGFFSWRDLVADSVGALLGLLIFRMIIPW